MANLTSELQARIEDDYKKRFKALAKKRGMTESRLLRQLAMNAIGAVDEADTPITLPDDPAELELVKTGITLPRYLLRGGKERAREVDLSFRRWLIALVQSHLTAVPVMLKPELTALEASDRQLAAIGRNINQIARALNTAFYETERVKLEKLAELSQAIEEQRAALDALIRISRNKWRVAE